MNSFPLKAQKYLLRLRMRNRLRCLTPALRQRKSAVIFKKICRLPLYQKAKTVFVYLSLPQEVQTAALVKHALANGKKVLAPRVRTRARVLEVCEVKDLKQDLKKGAFGILQPRGKAIQDVEALDLIVMPGLAFDSKGRRLGRGLGYFDRFLAKVKNVPKVGLAYKEQKVRQVPVEKHDIAADKVVTD